ncbi:type II secretion system pseudopilin TklG [Desulfuromonas sp. DDH964]|nr:type II secretion system pseudopilin TklG [Desulfuromonas sp. DDH964]
MTPRGGIRDERGFALLTVLVLVVVLGLALGLAGSSWTDIMQRAREEELFWRGDQYRKAIEAFYGVRHGGGLQMLPAKLEDLVRDPRNPGVVRYLRRLYTDPMTGGEWELIKDPSGRIRGVRSSSPLRPFRQAGFPAGYENFEGRQKYSEWEFVFTPGKPAPGTGPATPVPGRKSPGPGPVNP